MYGLYCFKMIKNEVCWLICLERTVLKVFATLYTVSECFLALLLSLRSVQAEISPAERAAWTVPGGGQSRTEFEMLNGIVQSTEVLLGTASVVGTRPPL